MTRTLALFIALLAFQSSPSWAETAADPSQFAPVILAAACGSQDDAPCAKAVPALASQTNHAGLEIKPVAGPVPLDAVCNHSAAMGIVSRDAARPAICQNRYDIVGRPLYPVYAFLLVLADAPFRHLDDFREEGANENPRVIATVGGAEPTFEALRQSNPSWRRIVTLSVNELDAALPRVAAGTADGIFAVTPMESGIVDLVRSKADDKGKPIYRFASIFPERSLFRIGDGQGHCLYRAVGLDFGDGPPLTTISTDAVLILGRGFHDARAKGGPTAYDALTAAIDKTRDALLAATKSPRDWRPSVNSCQ